MASVITQDKGEDMLIKDTSSNSVFRYGESSHDSLSISPDGRTLSYYNLQNGDGSRYGEYRFVMEDGEVPEHSTTPDAIHAECYFNIGGFNKEYRPIGTAQKIKEQMCDNYCRYPYMSNCNIEDICRECPMNKL